MPHRRGAGALVLVLAESLNDSKSMVELIVHANARLDRRVHAVPRPTSLTARAGAAAVRDWVTEIGRTVQGYQAAGRPVSAVVVHRDADEPDAAGAQEQKLARALQVISAKPVVPVQMIEAWWFLFPDAVESIRPQAWKRKLPRRPGMSS